MDLYLLAELKTISLKITTVDMKRPPADFRSNFEAAQPPILIDNGVAILENDKARLLTLASGETFGSINLHPYNMYLALASLFCGEAVRSRRAFYSRFSGGGKVYNVLICTGGV